MNSGAETGSPWRFASMTCPISWTNSSTIEPDPEPPAADPDVDAAETNIENRNLNLSRTTPNFARKAPTAAIGAHALRNIPRQSVPRG